MDRTEFQNIVLLIESVGPEDPLGPNAFGARTFLSISGAYDGPADECPAPTDVTAQLLQMRQAGRAILQWLSNPNVACPIPRMTLNLGNLNTQFWTVNQRFVNDLPGGYREDDMEALGLPTRPFRHINMEAWRDMGPNESAEFLGCWKGRAAPGVLFIEHIVRKKWGPWSAELCKIAYEQVAELSTLKTIFVCHIMNVDTLPQVRITAPPPELKLFVYGTPGYQTLLGTRIGKVVSYFILGAFGQGVKRIPRIAIWYIGQRQDILQMRFDLANIGADFSQGTMYALQRLLYGFPEPAPYKRSKPVEVLCLGLPHTGTESLSVALRTLGLPTYHGWDLVFELDGSKLLHCTELVRRTYNGARDGDVQTTKQDASLRRHQALSRLFRMMENRPNILGCWPSACTAAFYL